MGARPPKAHETCSQKAYGSQTNPPKAYKQTPTLILLQPVVEWRLPRNAIGQLWP